MKHFFRVGDLCIETTRYIDEREETLVVLLERNASYYEADWVEAELAGHEPLWRVGSPTDVGDDCFEDNLRVIAQ